MRDGIYKNPPISQSWRSVLRACTLDAERGSIALEKFKRAVMQDFQREIHPQFIRKFREKIELSESLLPGIQVFGAGVLSKDLGGQNSSLENSTIAHARQLEANGVKGAQLEKEAYSNAVKEYLEFQKRLMEQTIVNSNKLSDPEARATHMALQSTFKTPVVESLIDGVLAGSKLDLPPARRPIDLDEDLSRSHP